MKSRSNLPQKAQQVGNGGATHSGLLREAAEGNEEICAAMGVFIYVTGENRWLYFFALERPYRLAVRTPPFHGGGTGSIPVRVAMLLKDLRKIPEFLKR